MKLSATTGHLVPKHFTDEEAIQMMAHVGFDALDYGFMNHDSHTGRYAQDDYQDYARQIRRIADGCGIAIGQTHANFPSYFENPEEDAYLLELFKREIIATSLLGCQYMILHPAIPRKCIYDRYRDEVKEINMARYKALQTCAEEYNVVICIENMFSADPQTGKICPTVCSEAAEIVDYIETLNSDRFAACLDVGHSHVLGRSIADEIRVLGKHLKTLHIQDNNGLNDGHVSPFLHPQLATINWEPVCAALKEVGYSGTFSFETDSFMAAYPTELAADALTLLEKVGRYILRRYQL